MQEMDEDIKEYWLFWRLVIFGEVSFEEVDNMILSDILLYNIALDIKEKIYTALNVAKDIKL